MHTQITNQECSIFLTISLFKHKHILRPLLHCSPRNVTRQAWGGTCSYQIHHEKSKKLKSQEALGNFIATIITRTQAEERDRKGETRETDAIDHHCGRMIFSLRCNLLENTSGQPHSLLSFLNPCTALLLHLHVWFMLHNQLACCLSLSSR